METDSRFSSVYVAWLSLIWEELERVDRLALASICTGCLQSCASRLEILRIELNLQTCAVARLQSRRLLDPEDCGQVTALVEDLQWLLPDACVSSARVMRCVRAAQDRVFFEITILDHGAAEVPRRRA